MYLIITRSTDIVVLRFVRGRRNRKENKLPPRGSWVTHTRTERIPRESFYPVYDDHNNNRNNSNVMFSLKRGPETLHGRVRGRRARRYHWSGRRRTTHARAQTGRMNDKNTPTRQAKASPRRWGNNSAAAPFPVCTQRPPPTLMPILLCRGIVFIYIYIYTVSYCYYTCNNNNDKDFLSIPFLRRSLNKDLI